MIRKTTQFLAPINKGYSKRKKYNIYPSYSTNENEIVEGYETLVDEIQNEKCLILEGYVGVDWKEISKTVATLLKNKGKKVSILNIDECLRSQEEIEKMISPFLGGNDPVFGRIANLTLADYFDNEKINKIHFNKKADIHIIYGSGASLSKIEGFLVYFELPKNELQYRMRSKSITNLGISYSKDSKQMYKHFYFIDWIVLNAEKKKLLPKIAIIVDQQRPNNPVWMKGEGLRNTLSKMSQNYFRVRPWFEPGVWGGDWMKKRFDQLNNEVPNYAWSFEMIVPENGLLLEYEGKLLEVSFDMLMFHQQENILGKAAKRFKDEFPIRFDFLDTFNGGNLSVQCHPSPNYIKKEFGENFTQDETYYILDAKKDTNVYLGFQEGINPTEFKEALNHSYTTKEVLDVEKYVQKLPSKKHDLFLIPHGTIHCSGMDNMVLEISATPYIYTFKVYDWQRLDLDGKPRPLNIDRAFENLNFERRGQVVLDTLISKPILEASGENWKKIHLPTHPEHFYDIYRYEFIDEVVIETLNQCHIVMLVEGTSVELTVNVNESQIFKYAETFAIPAASKQYKLKNKGNELAKVIISFVKDEAC
ncbi:MAG: class I mannose-6-phosphate isomerase [Flavobacteriaceae bacterium]|nr:class I mannose-6-phosphate isomerase [Flavobacteriaceae bacterium]